MKQQESTERERRKAGVSGCKKAKWMIRDVDHGKTFSFDSYEHMAAWIKLGQDQLI